MIIALLGRPAARAGRSGSRDRLAILTRGDLHIVIERVRSERVPWTPLLRRAVAVMPRRVLAPANSARAGRLSPQFRVAITSRFHRGPRRKAMRRFLFSISSIIGVVALLSLLTGTAPAQDQKSLIKEIQQK